MEILRLLPTILALLVPVTTPSAFAQLSPPSSDAPPAPIYWKQNLFLIPYQWSSAADPGAAQAVWLLVSKDRGATWQKISEAKPQVRAFNYHAEGDGEYWFAIRTIDRHGQPQPPGPYQPELRVIVDTTMPQITALTAQIVSGGMLEIMVQGSDANLDSSAWKFEVQLSGSDTWLPIPLAAGLDHAAASPLQAPPTLSPGSLLRTSWQIPAGSQPRALRATVYDHAGNSAAYGAQIQLAPGASSLTNFAPPQNGVTSSTPTPPASPAPAQNPTGWVAASDASSSAQKLAEPATAQAWPPGAIAQSPFRLSAGAGQSPHDGVTTYGSPALAESASGAFRESRDNSQPPDPVQFNLAATNTAAGETAPARPESSPDGPNIAPLEPFRQVSQPPQRPAVTRLPAVDGSPAQPLATWPAALAAQPLAGRKIAPPEGVQPKRVGSRRFALEYELEESGRWGVSTVDLWGTVDGGQTWRRYSTDDDNRSPVVAAVDEEGLYGFRIVATSAGGIPAPAPRSGDTPELWVEVDLQQPIIELTSIEPGSGNLADHLIMRWRAEDDNLEQQPIGLFYSTRPGGPWSTIATNLANSGEYAWQAGRHVPERFYLRVEARDTAGNLAAFQTREPFVLPSAAPAGRLRDVEPLGPTAAGENTGLR
jgi:hypothetical protein